jgi:predicted phosphodiesterase
VHDLKTLRIDPVASGIDVIVSGHTHVPKIDTVDGVLRRLPLILTGSTAQGRPQVVPAHFLRAKRRSIS